MCALGDWVEEGDLLVASKGSVGCGVPTTNFTGINGTWLDTARIDGPLVDSEDSRKRKGINVSIVGSQSSKTPDIDMVETGNGHADNQSEVLLDICKTEGHTLATKSVLKASSIEPYHREGNRHETDQSVSAKSRPDDPMTNEQQQEEIFPRLRTQYLEALYISKVSCSQHIAIPELGHSLFCRPLLHILPRDRYLALVPHSKEVTVVLRWTCRIYVPFIGIACYP